MILWVILTAMIAVAAVFVAAPFIRRIERRRSDASLDVAVYRDQLKEVDAEAGQGLIDAEQAAAARVEIKRRALAAGADATLAPGLSGAERSFAAIGVAAVVIGGAVTLFALTGDFGARNDLSDDVAEAEAPRAVSAPATSTVRPAMPTAAGQAAISARPAGAPSKNLPPVDEMIQRIVKRLEANPKDISGWRMLGWSYAGLERYDEAANAYAKAIELAPDIAQLRSARADALVRANGGAPTPESMLLVEETLKLDPKDPRARYLNGLSKQEAGDKAGAIADWRSVVAEGDQNDAFILELKQKLMTLDGAPAASSAPAAAQPAPAPVDRGPTAQDVKKAESMSPGDRMAMIQGMVDTLAARLEQSPHDADGWIKLIRSRAALKDNAKASEALSKALKAFENEPTEKERIAQTARDLGVAQ